MGREAGEIQAPFHTVLKAEPKLAFFLPHRARPRTRLQPQATHPLLKSLLVPGKGLSPAFQPCLSL